MVIELFGECGFVGVLMCEIVVMVGVNVLVF